MLQEYLEATSTDGNLICLAGEAIINLCTWYFAVWNTPNLQDLDWFDERNVIVWLAKQLFFNRFSLWKLYELWLSWLFLVRLQDWRMWPFQFFIWREFDSAMQSLKFNLVESSPRSGLGSEQHSYKVLKPLSYHFQNFITLDTCRLVSVCFAN